jgi:hypothetical protein
MAGLLGGVLPAIYSGADQLKRQVYGLLTNPTEMANRAGQSLLQAHNERQALMGQAFGNPNNPTQVTNPQALGALTEQVMTGELGFAPAGITAWHGSPHKFNKFDMSKVGSGEGNQAFGHGMYFAEAPDVARSYMPIFEEKQIQNEIFHAGGDIDKAIQNATLESMSLAGRKDVPLSTKQEVFDLIDGLKKIKQGEPLTKGSLYKVDIPDEYVPTMMDWDKPLGEQSDFVKKAINNLKKQVTPEMKDELGGDLNILFGKDITPAQFLNTWEIIHPTGGTGIGERLLNEQGVKGIRYFDNPSREAKQGTSNFVVFDPTDVKILERNNQPVESLLGD